VLYAAPGGIGQLLERMRDVAVRRLARRRGIQLVDGFADGSAEAPAFICDGRVAKKNAGCRPWHAWAASPPWRRSPR